MEMEGTGLVLSYAVDVNENREHGHKMRPHQTPGGIAEFGNRMLEPGPKCSVGSGDARLAQDPSVTNGFPEPGRLIELHPGPEARRGPGLKQVGPSLTSAPRVEPTGSDLPPDSGSSWSSDVEPEPSETTSTRWLHSESTGSVGIKPNPSSSEILNGETWSSEGTTNTYHGTSGRMDEIATCTNNNNPLCLDQGSGHGAKSEGLPLDSQGNQQSCGTSAVPNGRPVFHEDAHFRQNTLCAGVRVGNCGFLVINRRSMCDSPRETSNGALQAADWDGLQKPDQCTFRLPNCEQESNQDTKMHRCMDSGSKEELGPVRPRSLKTKPGHTVSLSCDATPLSDGDVGRFVVDGDMEDVLDSVSGLDLGRRQSAPDKLEDDERPNSDGSFEQGTIKKAGITDFLTRNLFSWKPKETTPASSAWRIFGKFSPKENITKDSKILLQENDKALQSSRRKNLEFEPLSTTGLILENRPANLPAKSEEEAQRHRQEYNEMVAGARRREMKDAQRKKRQMKERYKQEECIARAVIIWNNEILPNWETMRNTRRVRELWWQGLPPSIRGKIWSLAIGNELNITSELYEIFLSRAKEKWRSFNETSSLSESEDCGVDKESSLDLIKLDIFRTFPSLYIFQKGGPYHDVLHSILGAYTCYRPDVGYVQGMSFIAAVLILNLEEPDAFIAFANLLNKPCQMAFFRVDHDLMLKYFAAFEVFFEENLPKLFVHFQNNSLTPDFYLIDWIFTLYSKPLPLDVACRVWDLFCRDGEEALFRTALGILRLYQDVLLQMDFIHIAQFLSRLPQDTPAHTLFTCIGNTHMLSNNRRWSQVFLSLMKDGPKETDKTGSPALRS